MEENLWGVKLSPPWYKKGQGNPRLNKAEPVIGSLIPWVRAFDLYVRMPFQGSSLQPYGISLSPNWSSLGRLQNPSYNV